MSIKIGILGGSGLYDLPELKVIEEKQIETPFGSPSDKIRIVESDGVQAAFLPRHGRGHVLTPSEIPVRANIYALKSLGVEKLISISAVGSLKEEIPPEDFVVPDQLIDRTKGRESTFFGDGIVGHIGFADPFCAELSGVVVDTLKKETAVNIHQGGTYICMEGPAFSTRAESNLYRSWGASIIGMTALPEAKLAREAEICYAMIAMSTDYDCWKVEEKPVTVEMVIAHMQNNTANAKKAIPALLKNTAALVECSHNGAAQYAVITSRDSISAEARKRLSALYGKYL